MNKKYQIFISSTYEDLIEERRMVRDAILSVANFPVGMESFGAAAEQSWEVIKETINSSDYYVLIIAHRYGTVTSEGISFTEKEYRYAEEAGIPILGFIIDKSVEPLAKNVDYENRKLLEKFKKSVRDNHQVDFWTDGKDLKSKVLASMHKEIILNKRPGWVRGDSVLEHSMEEVLKLNEENRKLRDELEEARRQLESTQKRRPMIKVEVSAEIKDPEISEGSEDGSVDEEDNNAVVIDIESDKETVDSEKTDKENVICIPFHRVPKKELNVEELTMDDVPDEIKNVITQEMLDEYNEALPNKDVVYQYERKAYKYKQFKYNSSGIDIVASNIGTMKASNVRIVLQLPDGLKAVERNVVDEINKPKAPRMPKNPINRAYMEYEKKRGSSLYDSLYPSPLEQAVSMMADSYVGFHLSNSMTPIATISDKILSAEALGDRGYGLFVENNEVTIWIDEFQHTGSRYFDECMLIPKEAGEYEIRYSIICDEYIAEESGSFRVQVYDDGWYKWDE